MKNDSLHQAIAREEAHITELTHKRNESRERLAALKAKLAKMESTPATPSAPAIQPDTDTPTTAEEKISLFRQLFRGRNDVFPLLWMSSKTGRKGYSPACGNEWVRGVCEKPRVKCSECPNQAFLPLNDQVVLDHLQGRHTIGVYPLLKDETCWFLAADFDKESWPDDVAVFVDTCRDLGVPTAVERSRSGNGAHVWFFFNTPVPAVSARRMGCYLITETMARRHQLAMNSYDRLFPNQDTLPRGGFGNLSPCRCNMNRGKRAIRFSLMKTSNRTRINGPTPRMAELKELQSTVLKRVLGKLVQQPGKSWARSCADLSLISQRSDD
jgi:hypothetical protein